MIKGTDQSETHTEGAALSAADSSPGSNEGLGSDQRTDHWAPAHQWRSDEGHITQGLLLRWR